MPVDHHCHWPSCTTPVEPARWGCATHWFTLPKALRDKVWANYRPGQEVTKTPSAAYVAVAREVRNWAVDFEAKRAISAAAAANPKNPAGPVKPAPDAQIGLDF